MPETFLLNGEGPVKEEAHLLRVNTEDWSIRRAQSKKVSHLKLAPDLDEPLRCYEDSGELREETRWHCARVK